MNKIPKSTIDAILAHTDIVSLIGQYVELQNSGSSEFKGCCPFHQENTPSFFVNSKKQFYHCFGCSVSGNAITFLREHLNLDFYAALEQLATSAGIEIPELADPAGAGDEFNALYQVLAEAMSLYKAVLYSKAGLPAREYIESRGICNRTVEQFDLGFAPDEWDFILSRLGKTTQQRQLLETAGLIRTSENGQNRQYDRFRGRLMCPIHDRRGRVVGFGGRVISKGDPKYLNSPETPLFKKRSALFGLNQARPLITDVKRAYLVEGYTDVLALSQHGCGHSVASLGTATTTEQLRTLFTVTPEVVFCYDGDTAGRQGALSALDAILPLMEDGRMASFAFLPQGQDPDSFVRSAGNVSFETRTAELQQPFDQVLLQDLNRSCHSSSMTARALVNLRARIQSIPGEILKGLIIAKVAEKINLPYEFVRQQLLLDNEFRH